MQEYDKAQLFDRLNAINEVFGKPKLSTAAAQVWWDTLRDQANNDVFGALTDWTTSNTKPPAPSDIWKMANNAGLARREAKAEQERLVNTGRALPEGYGPTPEGRAYFRIIKAWMHGPMRPIHHAILDAHENGEKLPPSVLAWAREQEEAR